jgi:hypothetical protein
MAVSSAAEDQPVASLAQFSLNSPTTRTVRVFGYVGGLMLLLSYTYWAIELKTTDTAAHLGLAFGFALIGLVVTILFRLTHAKDLAGIAGVLTAIFIGLAGIFFLFEIGFAKSDHSAWFNLHFNFDGSTFSDKNTSFSAWFNDGWFVAELIFLAASLVLYWFTRAPFMMFAVTLSVLLLLMDGFGRALDMEKASSGSAGSFLVAFGVLSAIVGVIYDYRGLRRHALWPHFFGVLLIVIGATVLAKSVASGPPDPALIVAGALLLLASVWLGRATYVAFGALTLWAGLIVQRSADASSWQAIVITVVGILLVVIAFIVMRTMGKTAAALERTNFPPQRD